MRHNGSGLAKKNAILRNGSRCLSTGLAVRLGFARSLVRLAVSIAQGPADADRRWAFHWGLRATGRDLNVVHSLFPSRPFVLSPPVSFDSFAALHPSPSSLHLHPASFSFSPNIFTSLLSYLCALPNPAPFAYSLLSVFTPPPSRCHSPLVPVVQDTPSRLFLVTLVKRTQHGDQWEFPTA